MTDPVASQIDYYEARADVYDDFWLRRGAYHLDEPLAAQWRTDAAETMAFVRRQAGGDVLELAAGTGLFTEQLLVTSRSLHAVDAAPAMLRRNANRIGDDARVSYELADIFAWSPQRAYDVVFFSFWLSHVPDERLDAFWRLIQSCLVPGGRVVLVDSRPRPGPADLVGRRTETRTLDDGRHFDVVKRYWTAVDLDADLTDRGWCPTVEHSTHQLMLRASATWRG